MVPTMLVGEAGSGKTQLARTAVRLLQGEYPRYVAGAPYSPAKSELALIHHNYQSVEQFIDRLNHYSSIQAQEQAGESVLELELASKFFNSFSQEFMARLFARQGIADGAHGMALSLLQATSEAVVQMKAWQQAGFKATLTDRPSVLRSLKQFQRDLNYWIADWQVNSNSGWRRYFWMVRRKFKL